ncbi:fumarylacetoacetate hydrolase family protein [Marinospirillum alkaliphilum]|uniref:Fumarylacetoacetate (FAA) hydrolase n=1 Tax=Marinospirillum alkaliphilum DSM 21637 TaxID=1122209 RepID=A0A1K1YFA2_9GAMM|nr:fumarylacetoacetate hydrolase family protein [Marinospirillum alkaliphilum]SFX60044.1 fumarylacetoacetate (FAA) hydrolase [Marinospirillum alkaliphilum DSM 21637]
MKLASLKQGRDGQLLLVSRDLQRAVSAADIAPTLQAALDQWHRLQPLLEARYQALNQGQLQQSFAFDPSTCHCPLPRAFHWADASAYVNHVELVRKARGAEMPASFWEEPLMYQGGSDTFIPPHDPIRLADEAWGIDLEGEVAVVTDDVPMGISAAQASHHILLVMLVNDVSLRNLIPAELAKGFGFYQSKPSSSFSPVAVTPDELGRHWRDGRVHLPLLCQVNDELLGCPDAGVDMTFNFFQLVAHAAKTRPLGSGTIIGSGTVSNRDSSVGSACLAEKRMLEILTTGQASTAFLRFGDRVRIEMLDTEGRSIFGALDQLVEAWQPDG